MKGHQETLGGQAEEYRRMMLESSRRHDGEINQLKNTIAELQAQVYEAT